MNAYIPYLLVSSAVIFVGLVSCVKEDIDSTIITTETTVNTETNVLYDCEFLSLNIGDTCENTMAETIEIVDEFCDCQPSVFCNLNVDIISNSDNSTGIGFLEAVVTNGTEPYEVRWFQDENLVGSEPSITGLSAGLYVLEVLDADSCFFSDSVFVEIDLSSWDCPFLAGDFGDSCQEGFGIIDMNCECNSVCEMITGVFAFSSDDGNENGEVTFFINGGSAPYHWNLYSFDQELVSEGLETNSQGLIEVENLPSGFYFFQTTDNEGCTSLSMVLI